MCILLIARRAPVHSDRLCSPTACALRPPVHTDRWHAPRASAAVCARLRKPAPSILQLLLLSAAAFVATSTLSRAFKCEMCDTLPFFIISGTRLVHKGRPKGDRHTSRAHKAVGTAGVT